jgi:hypothetical protein
MQVRRAKDERSIGQEDFTFKRKYMDKKLEKSEKAIESKTKKEFKGLLKEDHKLDAKRDKLESALKKKKK